MKTIKYCVDKDSIKLQSSLRTKNQSKENNSITRELITNLTMN